MILRLKINLEIRKNLIFWIGFFFYGSRLFYFCNLDDLRIRLFFCVMESIGLGRTIAIGDIHGCLTPLKMLIGEIDPTQEDLLVFLGDYVDRGPDSAKVINYLLKLKTQFQTVFLLGNHEVMMSQARSSQSTRRMWMMCGGTNTLDSYEQEYEVGGLVSVPQEHWDFIEHCQLVHETNDAIFVHGCYDGNDSVTDQVEEIVCWRTVEQVVPPDSGKKVICGHTSQKGGVPLVTEHAICIDTWVYGKGWLTALDVGSGKYWQANRFLDERTGQL